MFKFIHAADIHLDSQLQGLSQYEGAPVELIRGATRRAFRNLVDLALHEQVAFVLIAGDVYDGDWKDYSTGQFFCQQVGRLHEAGIQTLLVLGNHDAASVLTKSLRLPGLAHQFSSRRAETITIDGLGVAVHGCSFARKAVTENLAAGYPAAIPGLFNIGLLHTAAGGSASHENYAPCTTQDLVARGYRYWALGHVHAGTELLNTDEQWIGFSGNLQGRHINEPGAKGCRLVTVEGEQVRSEPRELSVLRWEHLEVDASDAADPDAVLDAVEARLRQCRQAAGVPLCTRLELTGATPAHAQLVWEPTKYRREIESIAARVSDDIWVEGVTFSTAAPASAGRPASDGEIQAILRELAADSGLCRELAAALGDLDGKLPAELREGPGRLGLSDEAALARYLGLAAAGLSSRLEGGNGHAD